ncbi:helix-turn-helix transcriptional regulator [Actinosynnema sp. NPDC020468]|uniref:helix-turn-helix domain-containing protein n=1 Tax=Actinosynnema sp. NPDC020468 TaxID=3154488 RepID=UPI0033D869BF
MVREQNPTSYKLQLGAALERFRLRAGLPRKAAADELGCSEGKIGTIERGDVAIRAAELKVVLDLYGVTGDERADVEHLASEAKRRRPRTPWGSVIPDRLKKFFTTEETAVAIDAYLPELLHGLVQTENYARAVLSTNSAFRPEEVERLVYARMARQALLETSDAPALTLVVPESVIRAQVGGPAVMVEQLAHLRRLARRSEITIRVIPTALGAHAGSGLPFTILTPPQGRRRMVYVETLTDGLFVDEPLRVAKYEVAFREMLGQALSPTASTALIASVAGQL